jgi:hypothetical protein
MTVQRDARGRWLPGQSANPRGREKMPFEIVELARQRCPKAIETLESIMLDTTAPPAARVAAATALLDRGYGKPAQQIVAEITEHRAFAVPLVELTEDEWIEQNTKLIP